MKNCYPALFLSLFSALALHGQDTCTVDAIQIPDALDTWQLVSGSYPPGGSVSFELPLAVSNSISYEFKTGCGNGATADHATVIEYRTPPPCILVNSESSNCADGGTILPINFVVYEGPSRIRVRGADGAGGSFTMAYRSIGGTPGICNECPSYDETLAPGSYWQTTDWSYVENGCRVYYFQAHIGLTYEFKTGCGDGATADHDTRIALSSYTCMESAADDNSCGSGRSHLTWTATWNGGTFVRVSGANNEAGSFTMAYRRSGGNGSACGTCTQYDANLPAGWLWNNVSGSYLPGGCQIYRFHPDSGYVYTVKTGCGNGASADHDARLEVFDPSCNLVMTGSDACGDSSSTVQVLGTGQGWLYLRVSGNGGSGGSYTLATRKGGTCPTCPGYDQAITATEPWQSTDGHFLENGCMVYKMEVEEGRSYFLQLECTDCEMWSDSHVTMEVMDSACAPVNTSPNWPSWDPDLRTFLATYTGAVYVRVHGSSWKGQEFSLSYMVAGNAADQCADAPLIPIPLEGSVMLHGDLSGTTAAGDFLPGSPWEGDSVAWYAVELSDYCYNFLVRYCGQDPAWDSTMNFLATDCLGDSIIQAWPSIYFPCDDGNASHEFYLQPGTYYLPILYQQGNSGGGAYTIELACSNVIIDHVAQLPPTPAWQLRPNPGIDGAWLSGGTGPATVSLMDAMGREVYRASAKAAPFWIDAKGFPSGLYLIRMAGPSGVSTQRWVKE